MVQMAFQTSSASRLALCDRSTVSGAVDGAWWPGSRDLRSELPDLVTSVDPYTLVAEDTIYLIGTHSRDAVLFIVPPSTSGRALLGAGHTVTEACEFLRSGQQRRTL